MAKGVLQLDQPESILQYSYPLHSPEYTLDSNSILLDYSSDQLVNVLRGVSRLGGYRLDNCIDSLSPVLCVRNLCQLGQSRYSQHTLEDWRVVSGSSN